MKGSVVVVLLGTVVEGGLVVDVVVVDKEVEEWEAAGRPVPQPAKRTVPTIRTLIPTVRRLLRPFIIELCSPPGNAAASQCHGTVATKTRMQLLHPPSRPRDR
jgi:hypothetical protein